MKWDGSRVVVGNEEGPTYNMVSCEDRVLVIEC